MKTQCAHMKTTAVFSVLYQNCALVFRPLKRDQDIGSDTDFTQSSMEDLSVRCSRRQDDASICDHRTQEQKHYRAGAAQPRRAIQCKETSVFCLSCLTIWLSNLYIPQILLL